MKKYFILATAAVLSLSSCSKDFLSSEELNVTTDADIAALAAESPEALLDIANSFDQGTVNNIRTFQVAGTTWHSDYGQKSVDIMMDLMGNDMIDIDNGWWYDDVYKFIGRTQDAGTEAGLVWNYYYTIIKGANQTIGLIGGIDPSQLNDQLRYVLARSKVVRGFSYLQLIQIFQKGNPALTDAGVPIIDPTADLINGPGFGRLTVADTYNQIEKDLTEGYDGLAGYARPDKTSINQNVAAGFLARFYLLTKDYTKAANMADVAIAGASLAASQLTDGFQFISNPEWLWGADLNADLSSYYASFFSQIQSYSAANQANFGTTLGYPGQLGHHRTVDKRLHDKVPATDVRNAWYGPDNGFIKEGKPEQFYNYKFYDNTDFEGDYSYMRVAEMYLIKAEALLGAGNDSGAAQALFDLVSTRDTAYTLSTNTGAALLDEIKWQRRIELWGEGFGLLDLKRWGDDLIRVYPGSNHLQAPSAYYNVLAGDPRLTFQIPLSEINLNDAISASDQNP
ncbi:MULTISPECIES: RagB/SusD family nutrient uptake outer membrane protein [unclassified Tenacibaculum]|uniref:RagB/SusD family nutrient uptake outer membrane protein n=1 Tax=unclassified Tenacibaculum TaxID=2635139 RepID=UPI001F16FAA0|nr:MULTISPECIES: RagB/SusD family nutrient uptake outer membrane protein [unclassified Tenacibaculum]MCF2873297.1 RagB/SusD family nutrient uptake outer membrane protein [Tenacibaculum sp. Cn5-1]MCF2933453.1 RagB/SusD family nutrient uptake outer membrane protein [Tenacibaculum sp. Cn5-34]MCG7509966.1 RagB/SusD family nutrient uptake outer membrane protein [Tenacibaculum sp. Cn5-46]